MAEKDRAYFEHLEALVAEYRGIDPEEAVRGRATDTLLVRGYGGIHDETGSVSAPIYPSTSFAHPGHDDFTGYTYARCGNPTRLELEDTIAALEGGTKAFALSSGMAAITTLAKLLRPGDHVVVGDDLYGGTYRLFDEVYARYGIDFEYVDACDLAAVRAALRRETRLVFVETPTNPMMKVADIAALAELAHGAGALLAVDNTLLTPYFQRPLALGADIVVHSGTKYLCGHNDVLCGFLVLRDSTLVEQVFDVVMSEGAVLSPTDSWLMLRSLKTLGVRLERQQANALRLAAFLRESPHVTDVIYVGDPDRPDYELTRAQTTGFGAMISFRLDTHERVTQLLDRVRLVLFAESLGGVETFVTYPLEQTHGSIPPELRARLGIDERLLRLSVGIEDACDLEADLAQALA